MSNKQWVQEKVQEMETVIATCNLRLSQTSGKIFKGE